MSQPPNQPEPMERAAPVQTDWTGGIAKWTAVVVLGCICATGISWSLLGRQVPVRLESAESDSRGQDPVGESARAHESKPTASLLALIDLNTASSKELESLPGIGPALAGRIIEDREKNGAYRTVDQLDRVRGIGPKVLEKLRPLVKVEPSVE